LLALDDVEKQLGDVDAILGDLLDVTRAGLSDSAPRRVAWSNGFAVALRPSRRRRRSR